MENTGQPNQGIGAPYERLQQQNNYPIQQVGNISADRNGQGGYSSDEEQQQVNTENDNMHNERDLDQLNTEQEQMENPNEGTGTPDEGAGQTGREAHASPGGLL